MRLVVRTLPGAAAAVTRAAEAAGATRTGHVRALHSVSFEVPAADTARLRDRLSARADVTSVGVAHRRWFDDEPADPKFGEQRNYLAAIGLPAAWDRGATGSAAVRIAIVDSGVDVRHPDLAGKVVGTHNAVTGGTDVHDVVGHGTGTASVAAAATGNGVGIAGAGRNTSLLAVKVADVTGRIFTDDLAAGIVWAVDHGADVVNLSLGGPTSDRLEKAAVAYAEAHDVLVVAAAGNEGTLGQAVPGRPPRRPGGRAPRPATAPSGRRSPATARGSTWPLPGRSIVVATPGGGYEVGRRHVVLRSPGLRRRRAAGRLPARPHRRRAAAGAGRRHRHRPDRLRPRPAARRPRACLPAPGNGTGDLRTRRRQRSSAAPSRSPRRQHRAPGAARPGRPGADRRRHRRCRERDLLDVRPRWAPAGVAPPTAASSTSASGPTRPSRSPSTTRHPRSPHRRPARRSAATR